MMELLKRLEKESQEDDQNLLETDDDVDEDATADLAHRLGAMDICGPRQYPQCAFLIMTPRFNISG
jgi:hypothetical protein